MIRAVFDTNVYISGFNYRGTPREILLSADDENFQLLISKQIIGELRGVLRVKFHYDVSRIEAVEQFLLSFCEVVEPQKKFNRIIEDPTDNMILECAVEGKADYIVSGDKHILKVREFYGIKILNPSEFFQKTSKI